MRIGRLASLRRQNGGMCFPFRAIRRILEVETRVTHQLGLRGAGEMSRCLNFLRYEQIICDTPVLPRRWSTCNYEDVFLC
ncbi:hypothetical protein WN55_01607 [Dufourea novaeangliae]|uniref:Uncharacterized protein n=1 Tax=Dufourea novaeangliae TaxID=178035 RepID=A0A154PHV2_DUFNO|nr:hypothetical protein WN55_01607 [Dufourea novaeangliae]